MSLLSKISSVVNTAMDNFVGSNSPNTVSAPAQAQPAQVTNVAPAQPAQAQPAQVDNTQVVSGTFVPDETVHVNAMGNGAMLSVAQEHTEHFRKVVETFEEDKQEPVEWAIRQLATLFCYVAPFVVAFFIGMAAGDAFSVGQTSVWLQWGIHVLSLSLELVMPILGIATNITFKRAVKDRGSIPTFVIVSLLFLVLSVGNALVLYVLLDRGSTLFTSGSGFSGVAILLRSFGSLFLDIATTIYLSIANIKSLKKYLADQRQKIEAVREVNNVNIELDQANMKAAIDRMTAMSDMASKQKRAETWNQIESMQAEALIEGERQRLRGGQRRASW